MEAYISNKNCLRLLAEPTDVNFGGKAHGGAVMKWIDQAGYTTATGWSRAYCVTVYVGGIRFFKPVMIGDLVEIDAEIIHTGRSSMHIMVDVKATNPRSGNSRKATHCIIVFAAVDELGGTITVPKWEPKTDREKGLNKYALRLHELRKDIEKEMSPFMGI